MESEIQQLKASIKKIAIAGIAGISVLVILLLLALQFTQGYISQLSEVQKTVSQLTAENLSITQTKSFLVSESFNIAQFTETVPAEEQFIGFVKKVEEISASFTADHELQFSSSVPVKDKKYLYVPFSLKMTISQSQFVPFLRQFERIPYLTEVTNMQIRQQETSDLVFVVLGAKVYVQNPFTQ
mgnify:CR=1 FL=1